VRHDTLFIDQFLVYDADAAKAFYDGVMAAGYEGMVLRKADGAYKQGRSTLKEGGFLKFVPRIRAEAKVVGFEEQMENRNEARRGLLGQTERSSHKANKVPKGALGAVHCLDCETGKPFKVASGFTDAERKEIWEDRPSYLGKVLTYEAMGTGWKDAPRQPALIAWRCEEDIS
jgi:DNA ligase-1